MRLIQSLLRRYRSLLNIKNRLEAGRNFTESEAMDRSAKVLVNEAFARKYFEGTNAVGRHLRIPMESLNTWATVTGVVDNVRNMDIEATPVPQIYIPLSWYSNLDEGYLVVRSMLPEDEVVADIRSVMKGIDPNLAIAGSYNGRSCLSGDSQEAVPDDVADGVLGNRNVAGFRWGIWHTCLFRQPKDR